MAVRFLLPPELLSVTCFFRTLTQYTHTPAQTPTPQNMTVHEYQRRGESFF